MAELTNRIRAWMRRPSTETTLSSRQSAARSQLHGHIDAALLDGFIRKALNREDHSLVLSHLNRCQACQEAIAVVLLANENPSAAAQIIIENEKRAKNGDPWWKTALHRTGVVAALFAFVLLLFLLPSVTPPGSILGGLLQPATHRANTNTPDSSTSVGDWIASTFSNQDVEESAGKARSDWGRNQKQASPGWDSGPAPYHDKVDRTPGPIEIEIKSDEKPVSTSDTLVASQVRVTSSGPRGGSQVRSARRLAVTDTGVMIRTLDGGATWKVITIKRGLVFRTLALSGNTIWAAGDNGALYRSPDAAEHWQQISVTYRSTPMNANITEIRFADPQHGFFTTADAQVWITVNGGANWVLNYRPQSSQ